MLSLSIGTIFSHPLQNVRIFDVILYGIRDRIMLRTTKIPALTIPQILLILL